MGSTVTHNGVKVLINDLTACTNTAEVLLALHAMVANTRLQASEMRTVTNNAGVTLDPVAMVRDNLLGKEVFKAVALRSAVVGVVGYKKILLRTFLVLFGHRASAVRNGGRGIGLRYQR